MDDDYTTAELGKLLYYSRIRHEFIPVMGPGEHAEFASVINHSVTEAEAEAWIDGCDDMLGCAAESCFGLGEPCECGAGHCHRHPHTN